MKPENSLPELPIGAFGPVADWRLTHHAIIRFCERHARGLSFIQGKAALESALQHGAFQESARQGLSSCFRCITELDGRRMSFRVALEITNGVTYLLTVLPADFHRESADRHFKRIRKNSPTWDRKAKCKG